MTRILPITFLLFGFNSFGQVVKIDTLKLVVKSSVSDIPKNKMSYPIIRTGNAQIDFLINHDLKNKFTQNEYLQESIDTALYKWASNGIAYLNFEVTYNKGGIISLNISAEGCGAYCTNWTAYYNYSTVTGKSLDINSVIDVSSDFGMKIFEDKKNQFENQRRELKHLFEDKKSELDTATYEFALEHYNECEKSFTLEKFALYPDRIKVISDCWLPHMILHLIPVINLEYKYVEIKKRLKIKN